MFGVPLVWIVAGVIILPILVVSILVRRARAGRDASDGGGSFDLSGGDCDGGGGD